MKKKDFWRRFGAGALAAALMAGSLVGCGQWAQQPGKEKVGETGGQTAGGRNGAEDTADREKASGEMGRYVEEYWELEEPLGECSAPVRLEDGSLAVFSYEAGPFLSKDEGRTWEPWQSQWFYENADKCYFVDGAIGPDGTIFTGCMDISKVLAAAEDGNQNESNIDDSEFFYQVVSPDGKSRVLDMEYMSGQTGIWFAPDGTCYLSVVEESGGTLYEISLEEERKTVVLESDSAIEQLIFRENELIAFTPEGAIFYDRETQTQKEQDTVLDSFLQQIASLNYNSLKVGNSTYAVYAQPGADGRIYLCCDEGIYAHVPGGGTMEKLAEGSFSHLGDPTEYVYGMIPLADMTFLVVYESGVGLFSYHEDVPAVPEKELQVFSFYKDEVVQKAVSLFQQEHPEVYVEYQIGLRENSGQTKEDVIKTLNMEILAGNGPDVMILDGFPIRSYVEKGLLADLSNVLTKASESEELFTNLTDAFTKDGKLYAIPMRCRIPVMVADKSLLQENGDLKSIQDAAAFLRSKKEIGSVMGGYTAADTLGRLAFSCAPAWENADGSLNEAAVREFLEAAQTVYAAESQGISEQWQKEYQESRIFQYGAGPVDRYQIDMEAMRSYGEENRMGLGLLSSGWGLQILTSIGVQKEGLDWQLQPGQAQKVFYPSTMAAILTSAKEKELAEEFLVLMSSSKVASVDGISFSKTALEKNMSNMISDGEGNSESEAGLSMSGEDGRVVTLELYQISREEMQHFCDMIASLQTPYISGSMLENAVLEAGEKMLLGEIDLDTAMQEIKSKVRIAMVE